MATVNGRMPTPTRSSLGLGTADSPTFAGETLSGPLILNSQSSGAGYSFFLGTGLSTDSTMRGADGANRFLIINSGHGGGDNGLYFNADNPTNPTVLYGNPIGFRQNAAPADGTLAAGDFAFWFDKSNGAAKLRGKAKTTDGTVVTFTLASD